MDDKTQLEETLAKGTQRGEHSAGTQFPQQSPREVAVGRRRPKSGGIEKLDKRTGRSPNPLAY